MTYTSTIVLLVISLLLLLTTMYITLRVPKKSQVQKMMLATNLLLISWCIVAILEETWRNTYGTINMIYINLTYISICFVPIFVFLFGLSVPAFVSALLYNKFFQKLEDQIAAENAEGTEISGERVVFHPLLPPSPALKLS